MKNQDWFKKNASWIIPLVLFAVYAVYNSEDIVRGFNDGWNAAQ